MINLNTLTYEYNPSGCRQVEAEIYKKFRNNKISKHIKRLIIECTGSKPSEIDYIYAGSGRYYPVVKCTDNDVYVIDFGLYELQIVRKGYTEGNLSDLCNHMRNCWSMLAI